MTLLAFDEDGVGEDGGVSYSSRLGGIDAWLFLIRCAIIAAFASSFSFFLRALLTDDELVIVLPLAIDLPGSGGTLKKFNEVVGGPCALLTTSL